MLKLSFFFLPRLEKLRIVNDVYAATKKRTLVECFSLLSTEKVQMSMQSLLNVIKLIKIITAMGL